jgi:hypothetical protein
MRLAAHAMATGTIDLVVGVSPVTRRRRRRRCARAEAYGTRGGTRWHSSQARRSLTIREPERLSAHALSDLIRSRFPPPRPRRGLRGGNVERVWFRAGTGEVGISFDTIPWASPRLERGTVECLCQLPICDHPPDHCTRLAARVYWVPRPWLRFAYVFFCDACDDVSMRYPDKLRRAVLGRIAAPRWWILLTNGLVLSGLLVGVIAAGRYVMQGVVGLLS